MSDNALNHADAMADYDPWYDNDAAHAAIVSSIKKLNERIVILEENVKAIKEVTEHLYRQSHNIGE